MQLIAPLVLICWSFISMFWICNFGQSLTNQFHEVSDAICQSDWYSFSPDVKRMVMMIMMTAQQPVILRGFGNVLCTRETFKKV